MIKALHNLLSLVALRIICPSVKPPTTNAVIHSHKSVRYVAGCLALFLWLWYILCFQILIKHLLKFQLLLSNSECKFACCCNFFLRNFCYFCNIFSASFCRAKLLLALVCSYFTNDASNNLELAWEDFFFFSLRPCHLQIITCFLSSSTSCLTSGSITFK